MKIYPELHDRRARAGGVHWALLLVCALLALATLRAAPAAEPAALPIRFEAQAGQCAHTKAEDGVWWSSYYAHQFDLRSPCAQIGISRVAGHWRGNAYGWRLAYVDLGRIKAANQFTIVEPQYPGETGATCNLAANGSYNGCLGLGIMSQRTRGFSVGGFVERPVGRWNLGLEGGAYAYYSRFEVDVLAHPDRAAYPPMRMVWGDWLLTPYVGATVQRGAFFATGRIYTIVEAHESGPGADGRDCFGCTGMTDHHAWQLTVGVQIPIK